MNAVHLATLAVGIALLCAPTARADRVVFSDASSDSTPAALLRATLEYAFSGPSTLEIAVTNETDEEAPFDVSLLFFNTSERVAYLDLVLAESSVEGENTDAWRVGYYGYDLLAPYFGEFDYSLRTDPRGPAADRIAPGETQRFVLSMRCDSYVGCGPSDWLSHESDLSDVGRLGAYAALYFGYGPRGDAAAGAATTPPLPVPEPTSGALVAAGLALLAARRRAAR